MIAWYLMLTIAGVPTGARYETREACETAALKVAAAGLAGVTVECVERVKK